jgi:hypothetical protein
MKALRAALKEGDKRLSGRVSISDKSAPQNYSDKSAPQACAAAPPQT